MDLIHITITFQDTFSGAKEVKHCTRSIETFEKMKSGIGAIVNKFENHINYAWEVIKVEQDIRITI